MRMRSRQSVRLSFFLMQINCLGREPANHHGSRTWIFASPASIAVTEHIGLEACRSTYPRPISSADGNCQMAAGRPLQNLVVAARRDVSSIFRAGERLVFAKPADLRPAIANRPGSTHSGHQTCLARRITRRLWSHWVYSSSRRRHCGADLLGSTDHERLGRPC